MAAFRTCHARDGEGGRLGLGRHLFQFGSGALGRVVQLKVSEGAARQPVGGHQTGIGVFGSQAGHGHGALDQPGLGSGRQVGGGHRGLAAADEDAQAEVAAFLAFDVFQHTVADAD